MYNQMMNGFNVGGAKIDARLQNNVIVQGEPVQGQIIVANGGHMQEVGDLYMRVYAWLTEPGKHKGKTVEIAAYKLANAFTVQPNQQATFPFQIQIPFNTPATGFGGTARVWLRTTLDTYASHDPTDDDYIDVRLSPLKERSLAALQRLGLQLFKVDCEDGGYYGNYQPKHGHGYQQPYPQQPYNNQPYGNQPMPNQPYGNQAFNPPNFNQPGYQNQVVNALLLSANTRLVQEFEFRPNVPQYRNLDELDVVFYQWQPNELEVHLEIDRRRKGFFAGDERAVRLHVNSYNFNEQQFMYELDHTIRRWING
jgi:sporulation-control protein spo0M